MNDNNTNGNAKNSNKDAKHLPININAKNSKKYLKEILFEESEKTGTSFRYFCGDVLDEVITRKDKYGDPLKSLLPSEGQSISIMVLPETKKEIIKWAEEKNNRVGKFTVFLLEKWVEEKGLKEKYFKKHGINL